jgi:hypothetical protein
MLKINIVYLLIFCLVIFYEETRWAQATPDFSLRKFAINFKEAIKSNLKKKIVRKHKEAEEKRKEEEKRRKEAEEKKKMENIEALRRKVFQEYLLNHITGKTTVLKDFFSRF